MQLDLQKHIGQLIGSQITQMTHLSGGDISMAYCLYTKTSRYFCKINKANKAYSMFMVEKNGLEAINRTNTINAPEILFCGQYNTYSYLIMEYIEPKIPSTKDMALLGHKLAAFHQSVSEYFGWEIDNFIGSLPQSNKNHQNWASFYIKERLEPQFKLARDANLLKSPEIPSQNKMMVVCSELCENVKSSFLHGDLWSGNYLISSTGIPYLIDPAVYFGHHEVDIAMTRLFGGFDPAFYKAYEETFPKQPMYKERNDLYQLYYLLVHLNLFGNSYYSSVISMLKTYFNS